MFSQKKITKSVIKIDDAELSYVTLAKNNQGFFVQQHETIELPEGVIVRGEILKADMFLAMLKKIAKNLDNKKIDILLSHEYFLCVDAVIDNSSQGLSVKKRIQGYFKNTKDSQSWHTTHAYEFSLHTINNRENILFKCLPTDIQKSYDQICKQAGLKVASMSSDILAFDHLLMNERVSLIHVGAETTRVVEFKSGMFVSNKKFQVSYNQFVQDIEKNLNVSSEQSRAILDQYGLLRSHKEEKVYTRLLRSISPLVDFLSKKKIKASLLIRVVFDEKPIPGFVDYLAKALRVDTAELDVIYTNKYVFQDILSLHRDESYHYQSLIAQALKSWNINKLNN